MNKTYIIAGSTGVICLAAGGTGGYFFARSRLTKKFVEDLEREVREAREYYTDSAETSRRKVVELEAYIQNLLNHTTPETNADISDEELEDETEGPQPTPAETEQIERRKAAGKKAMVDYGGLSTGKVILPEKPPLESLTVTRNIFSENVDPEVPNVKKLMADPPRKNPPLPPRDSSSGRFLPKQPEPEEVEFENYPEEDNGDYATEPYIITQQQFLRGKEGYDQENLKYYILDDTVLDTAGEVIENDVVGEGNLQLFPADIDEEEDSVICVRNDQKKMDYEILLVTESLTTVMGFDDSGSPESQFL